MVLKALAAGAAVAAVVVVVVALLLPVAPAASFVAEPAPGGALVLLPGGVAAPQLQPAQPASAPALLDVTGQKRLAGVERLDAVRDSFTLADLRSARAVTAQQVTHSCGGE